MLAEIVKSQPHAAYVVKLTHLKTRWNQMMRRSTIFSFQFFLVRLNRSLMSSENYSQGGLGIPDLKTEASQSFTEIRCLKVNNSTF